jgi:hypothetical protein
VTHRLPVIAVAGLVATLACGGFALSLRGNAGDLPRTAPPTWNLFNPAQWSSLGSKVGARGFDPATMKVVAGQPHFVIVTARRGGRTCFFVVRGIAPAPPICRLERPVVAFTARDSEGIDVIGLARRDVDGVVALQGDLAQGSMLLPAAGAHAFGSWYPSGPVVLIAHAHLGAVVARLYCASALRGVCGTSAHRRS